MDREHAAGVARTAILLAAIVGLLLMQLACGFARFDECTTVHPWWYCL